MAVIFRKIVWLMIKKARYMDTKQEISNQIVQTSNYFGDSTSYLYITTSPEKCESNTKRHKI